MDTRMDKEVREAILCETVMSQLLAFYRGQSRDSAGRTLDEILAWSDDDLEEVHDFIQWLFPLPEPSQYNPDAPLLVQEDIDAFHSNRRLQENLHRSFERILTFLGLTWQEGRVVEGPSFKSRCAEVWSFPNHNWLRITRILRSLRLLGLEAEAQRVPMVGIDVPSPPLSHWRRYVCLLEGCCERSDLISRLRSDPATRHCASIVSSVPLGS